MTFSASSKLAYLLAAAALFSAPGAFAAETGVISAIGSGKDSPEAITTLLKSTIAKYFREEPPALTKNILQSEILPNASSFVQSYKIMEGSKPGSVSLSANVDLDVIHGLLSLTPKNIGEAEATKALVLVHGAKFPEAMVAGMKPANAPPDPFLAMADAARERFQRREFAQASSTSEAPSMGEGEDFSNQEFLRSTGLKAGARIVLAISGRFESHENENSHNREDRLVVTGTMVDVKAGTIIAHSSVNVVPPKTRKEQYVLDLQRSLLEESKDLFQDLFVAAGRKLVKMEVKTEFAVVRVRFPSNASLVQRFKALLESIPGIRSVSDYSVRRGKYDFAIRPALPEEALAKAIAALQSTEITVAIQAAAVAEGEAHPPAVTVKLSPKDASSPSQPAGEGEQNEVY